MYEDQGLENTEYTNKITLVGKGYKEDLKSIAKEKLEEAYNTLNSGRYGIVEDLTFYDDTMKRMINYLPDRLPFFDCLYIEIMEQIGIKQIATFDKHYDDKGLELIK